MTKITSQTPSSSKSLEQRAKLYKFFSERPFGDADTLVNLTLFMRSGSLSKLLFLNEIYEQIVEVPGAILEFGTYLGGSTVAFENLRAVHEPYNHLRRIFTFDTFSGYKQTEKESNISDVFKEIIDKEVYTTPQGYVEYLSNLLSYHEQENVMSHITKHQVIEGDVHQTLPKVLDKEPSLMIALAYFDLAMLEPTKFALGKILPKMIKGSVIILDELGHPDYPSETTTFFEFIAERDYRIRRSKYLADRSIITLL